MELLSGKRNISPIYPLSDPPTNKENVGLLGFLVRIFLLSDEERLRAGIYIGAKGADWVERAALIIPSTVEDQDIL